MVTAVGGGEWSDVTVAEIGHEGELVAHCLTRPGGKAGGWGGGELVGCVAV